MTDLPKTPAPTIWNRQAKSYRYRDVLLCRCDDHSEVCYSQAVQQGLAQTAGILDLTKLTAATHKTIGIEALMDEPTLFSADMRHAFVTAANGDVLYYVVDDEGWRGYSRTGYKLAASGPAWSVAYCWHDLCVKEADEKAAKAAKAAA